MYHFRDLTADTAVGFSDEETVVLQIAQRDSVCSVRAPGRFARLIARVFAVRAATPLANARLEALRRAAILARMDGTLSRDERTALIGHGFSPAQVAALGG